MTKDTMPTRSISHLKKQRLRWKKLPPSEARTFALNNLDELIKYKQNLYTTACQHIQGYNWGKNLRKS